MSIVGFEREIRREVTYEGSIFILGEEYAFGAKVHFGDTCLDDEVDWWDDPPYDEIDIDYYENLIKAGANEQYRRGELE